MELGWHFRNIFRKLSGQMTIEEERFEKLLGIRRKIEISDERDPLVKLINDYSLASIVVSKLDGTVILGNGGSRVESVKGSALFDYVKRELPDASYLMVRTKNGVRVIYSDGEYIYIARSPGYVSPLEMKLLAKKFRSEIHAR